MSKVLATRGANVTIFARKQDLLDEAKSEILAARKSDIQTVTAVAADMSNPSTVRRLAKLIA
jgi:3-dehydrosphinganine reductase